MKLEDKLSPHFTVGEFCKSSAAKDLGIDIISEITKPIELNLYRVADKLEQARTILNCSININSGFRPPKVNEAIGGSKTSAHVFGLAADIFPVKARTNELLNACFVELANDPNFMFDVDQMILERGCIHIGLCGLEKQPRRELRGETYEGTRRVYPLIRVWGSRDGKG